MPSSLAGARRARRKPVRSNAASVARALVMAEADGLKGHGLSRVPMYASAGEGRKGRRPRHAGADAQEARADRGRRRQRLRLSGDRTGRDRAARHRPQRGRRRRGDPPLAPLRRGRPSGRAAGRSRPRRHHVRQHAVGDRAVGRIEGGARHQSGGVRLSAARPRAAGDRPVALQGGARQHHDGEAARRENPRRLGARRGRASRPPIPTRRSPAPWCRWATPRAPRWR